MGLQEKSRKVLIITYYYTPMQTPGAYRLASFTKYLPKYHFNPVIVAPELSRKTWSGYIDLEMGLNEEIIRTPGMHLGEVARLLFRGRVSGYGKSRKDFRSKGSSAVKRVLGFLYDEILTFPDAEWPWYIVGQNRALQIADKVKPDVILSSALPFTSHLMAAYIQKRIKIPWVADYRDLWSRNHAWPKSKMVKSAQSAMEKRILQRCSAITTVSAPLAVDMKRMANVPVHVVMNGFDPEEHSYIQSELPPDWNNSKTNMVYTGMIYPDKQDPVPLIKAVQILYQKKVIRKNDLKIWFYGPNVGVIRDIVSRYSVDLFFEIQGNIPRKQALNCQQHADLLLFLEWDDPNARGIFTAKFFEYLGAQKPILAIGLADGVIKQVLVETGMGVLENDPSQLSKILRTFLQTGTLRKDGVPHVADPTTMKKFTREYQAGVLANVLENVINYKGRNRDIKCQNVVT